MSTAQPTDLPGIMSNITPDLRDGYAQIQYCDAILTPDLVNIAGELYNTNRATRDPHSFPLNYKDPIAQAAATSMCNAHTAVLDRKLAGYKTSRVIDFLAKLMCSKEVQKLKGLNDTRRNTPGKTKKAAPTTPIAAPTNVNDIELQITLLATNTASGLDNPITRRKFRDMIADELFEEFCRRGHFKAEEVGALVFNFSLPPATWTFKHADVPDVVAWENLKNAIMNHFRNARDEYGDKAHYCLTVTKQINEGEKGVKSVARAEAAGGVEGGAK